MMEPVPEVGGFGDDFPFFWIARRGRGPDSGVHVAFTAEDRETVDAFHAAALAAGGNDNGGPGVREIYHPHYYGAFVLDPDGNNVEAVCHTPGLRPSHLPEVRLHQPLRRPRQPRLDDQLARGPRARSGRGARGPPGSRRSAGS